MHRLLVSFVASLATVILFGPSGPALAQKDAKKDVKGDAKKDAKIDLKAIDPKARYESVLSLYNIDLKPVPFYNLTVPDGKTLVNDRVRELVRNAKFNLGEFGFVGTAQFEAEADGDYFFDTNIEHVRINGREQGFGRGGGKVKLKKGVYELSLQDRSHGQPFVESNRIRIRNVETEAVVPIFNKGATLQKQLKLYAKYQEVSGWDPADHLIEMKAPAKK